MRKKYILFDLDGTLTDSSGGPIYLLSTASSFSVIPSLSSAYCTLFVIPSLESVSVPSVLERQ